MTEWLTSDPHLGHALVAGIRGFDNPDGHDAVWSDAFAATVKKNDNVWILGDLTGGGKLDYALNTLDLLPGKKHLILGNHDPAHPLNRGSHNVFKRYFPTFESVQLHARKSVAGVRVLLSHFPYLGDTDGRTFDRFSQWRLPNEGQTLVHGHTHTSRVLSRASGTTQVHVGWDTWYQLVNAEELREIVAW